MPRCEKCNKFIVRKSLYDTIILCKECCFGWKRIARLNTENGANIHNCYIDNRGYLRWQRNGEFVHRDVALKNSDPIFSTLDSQKWDVRHKDGDKLNNQLSNLVILTACENCNSFVSATLFDGIILCNYCNRVWREITEKNIENGACIHNCYIDKRGYLRWKENDRLVHRDVAFENCDWEGNFGELDVHHNDEDKFNNHPSNLAVITRREHEIKHGNIIVRDGQEYRRFARHNKIYRRSAKAIMVARKWIPLSQVIFVGNWIYATPWILEKKGFT